MLPIAVGLWLAREHGLHAGLIVLAGIFWMVEMLESTNPIPLYTTMAIEPILVICFFIIPPV